MYDFLSSMYDFTLQGVSPWVSETVIVKEYTSDLKRLNADLEGVSSAQTTLGNAVGTLDFRSQGIAKKVVDAPVDISNFHKGSTR